MKKLDAISIEMASAIITSAISATGGALVGYLFRGIERSADDVCSRLENATKEIQSILDVAVPYWAKDTTSDPRSAEVIAQEGEIRQRIHDLNKQLVNIEKHFSAKRMTPMHQGVTELRMRLTGNGFADQHGHYCSSAIVDAAYAVCGELKDALQHASWNAKRRGLRIWSR